MKTPMQELIEQLKEQAQFIKDYDCAQDKFYRTGLRNAIKYAESMLEKEEKVMSQVYADGGDWDEVPQPRFKNYYNQTFKTKER